jgi:transcriptional regulator with XRE-family HTH domain
VADREDVEIGALVARLRAERRLSQGQLARRVGTSRKRIAQLESGQVSPTLPFLDSVVGAMGREVGIRIREGWELLSDAVSGVGREYGLLLQQVGVDRVEDLDREDPEELWERLAIASQTWRAARRLPGPAAVRDWARQAGAKTLGSAVRPG